MLKTREEIENYMERFGGMDDWTINVKGEVDVPGNIKLQRSFFPDGQFPFQFGTIKGSFDCSNSGLKSLEGAPHTVERDFDCRNNELKTLTGAPRIANALDCQRNPLTSLGNIETQIESVFLGPSLPEFSQLSIDTTNYSLSMIANSTHRITAEDFNAKVQELKRIREEKALLESSVAKLCDSAPLGNSPETKTAGLQQTTIAPKRKFKI